MRPAAAASTDSKTASNNACLPVKWWYSAPFVTRAPATIASRLVPAYPWTANSCSATSTRARLVAAENSWRRVGRVLSWRADGDACGIITHSSIGRFGRRSTDASRRPGRAVTRLDGDRTQHLVLDH